MKCLQLVPASENQIQNQNQTQAKAKETGIYPQENGQVGGEAQDQRAESDLNDIFQESTKKRMTPR